ncbi:MAG: NADH oxidase [Spiroplasma poulsonii]|uniref:Putative NADH oxidase n=1 Tax=Spiroplasma poulsonii TaxID=2138 RepID=A0A2P6FBL9_9MOLU|nr:FAD-dependent oxidoreductase [Spiroplasma poulsonii]KAF0851231.1 putative NADH oxidase [Spiroplasma poulsonii]MBW1242188.1 NADH oxidase [Spiroplasma poulsonii]PQM30826.1 putative NADH oxidase [Spiroplasma poulsonii]PWF95816.1 putative NADH oxidase [Spiroplasma poulsonii]PWF98595.1 putative NADH oxidase [Spiroplasma poulsonii]
MKVIVVGTNHAGTTAVRTLRRLDPKAEIVTYDKNNNISFLGCGIALWVSGEVKDPKGLFYASPEILQSEGIKVNMEHEVLSVDNKSQKIRVKDLKTGKEFDDNYDKLILAIGSWPIITNIEGINQEGVHIVKWYQHGELVKKANDDKNIKNVVVCGAGYIGVELVDAFHQKGKNVTLVDILDRIMPRYYDKPFTDKVENAMREAGVNLRGGEKVIKFEGNNNKVTKVVTDKGSYDADLVIWSVGFKPSTEILNGVIDLDKNAAIMVDQYMRTSDPNIFAIGDCVEVYDNAKKAPAYIALATNAVRTGVIAAVNALKPEGLASPGFQGSNAINVFGWALASTGVTETVAKDLGFDYEQITFTDNDRPEFMESYQEVLIKILWDKKTRKIIGAQVGSVANHTEVMYMFSLAIMKGVTIDELPLVDIFFLPHFNKPYNFITLPALEVLGLNYFKK